MQDSSDVRVAIVQAKPVFLDHDASLEKAVNLIGQASKEGALLIAFGEAWLPGYPIHTLGAADHDKWWDLAVAYLDNSVEIPGPATEALCSAAREATVDIVIGVSERSSETQGTLYSTMLYIDANGEIIAKHRKMRPSPRERMVWADGDGGDLTVQIRDYGMTSTLASVEHQMVTPTYVLAEQGTQFHIAAWPGGDIDSKQPNSAMWPRQHALSRAFALQTGAFVLCSGSVLTKADVPEQYQSFVQHELTGASAVIDPLGEIIAGPAEGETILYADCKLDALKMGKIGFDCTGHSGRSDLLQVTNTANMMDGMDGYQDPEEDSDDDHDDQPDDDPMMDDDGQSTSDQDTPQPGPETSSEQPQPKTGNPQ